MSLVVVEQVSSSIEDSLKRIFDFFGGLESFVEEKKRAFVKVDSSPLKKYSFTSPEIITSLVKLLREAGVSNVYVMDCSPYGVLTRFAFKVTGIERAVKRVGGKPLYLDEQLSVKLKVGKNGHEVLFPRILHTSLLKEREENLYLSLPKLKTSRTTTVSLSLKGQVNLVRYESRLDKFNHQLHQFIVDLYSVVRPDFTILDALNVATPRSVTEKALGGVTPLNTLIGGVDSVSIDTVGAQILGYTLNEVEHLKLADEQGLGYGKQSKIRVIGSPPILEKQTEQSELPENVKVIEGRDMACPEGCKGTTVTMLEALSTQFKLKSPVTVIYGKGLNIREVEKAKPPILVVGPCAIRETAAYFKKKYGKENVHLVEKCGDPAKTLTQLLKIADIKPLIPTRTIKTLITRIHTPIKQPS